MTTLESAVFDLIRSMSGDPTPLGTLLDELKIQPEFVDVLEMQVHQACMSLAAQSKIWYADGCPASLRHHEPKPEPQRMLF